MIVILYRHYAQVPRTLLSCFIRAYSAYDTRRNKNKKRLTSVRCIMFYCNGHDPSFGLGKTTKIVFIETYLCTISDSSMNCIVTILV